VPGGSEILLRGVILNPDGLSFFQDSAKFTLRVSDIDLRSAEFTLRVSEIAALRQLN
jgi:hypothetical protein